MIRCFSNCFLGMAIGIGAWAILSVLAALVGALFGPGGWAVFLVALAAIGGLAAGILILAAISCFVSCGLNARQVANNTQRVAVSSDPLVLEKPLDFSLASFISKADFKSPFIGFAIGWYFLWEKFF